MKFKLPFEDANSTFEKFKDGLTKIQENNIDFFKSRPGKFEYQEHDELDNHVIIVEYENGKVGYLPHSDSDLPQNIIDQISTLYHSLIQ
jgi:hypothetical protein